MTKIDDTFQAYGSNPDLGDLDQVYYTSKGKRIGEGSECRILSAREAESYRYQFEGENPNRTTSTYKEFQKILERKA